MDGRLGAFEARGGRKDGRADVGAVLALDFTSRVSRKVLKGLGKLFNWYLGCPCFPGSLGLAQYSGAWVKVLYQINKEGTSTEKKRH